jgi:hypothetical protein
MGEAEIQRLVPLQDRFDRPAWVRRLNAMGDSIGGAAPGARRLVPIDADELLETAIKSLDGAGVGASGTDHDFGDPHWRRRFTALCRGVDALDREHDRDRIMDAIGRRRSRHARAGNQRRLQWGTRLGQRAACSRWTARIKRAGIELED